MSKVLLSCPTVDLDIVDNLGRGLNEMVSILGNVLKALSQDQLRPLILKPYHQVRDSWRLSTGEKAEVVHGFLKYLFVLVFNIKLFEVEELIDFLN